MPDATLLSFVDSFLTAPNAATARTHLGVISEAEVNSAITTAINNLVGAAPGTLDTLAELADALADDANFANTVTTSLAAKASLTGAETITNKNLGAGTGFALATLAYAATVNIDFSLEPSRTLALTGDVTFTANNHANNKSVTLRIVADGSARALAFPAGWVPVGAAKPTSIAAGKTAILTVQSFGTTDADVVMGYSVQP